MNQGQSTGRSVIFNLGVRADPAAVADAKKFGDEIAKVQKRIDETAAQSARRQVAEYRKAYDANRYTDKERAGWLEKVRRDNIQAEYQTNLKLIKEQRRANEQYIREAMRKDALIARNHLKSELKRIDDAKKAEIHAMRETQREAERIMRERVGAMSRLNMSRIGQAEGFSRAGKGGLDLARGFAYSGLLGEDDTQKILTRLLAIEAAHSAIKGGIDVWKGLAQAARNYRETLKSLAIIQGAGGAASLAGRAAPGAAAVAGGGTVAAGASALFGIGAAAFSGYETARDASRYGFGGGATPGTPSAYISDRAASAFSTVLGMLPRGSRGGPSGFLGAAPGVGTGAFFDIQSFARLADAREDAKALEAQRLNRIQLNETLVGKLRQYGSERLGAIGGNLESARAARQTFLEQYRDVGGNATHEARLAAAENLVRAESEVVNLLKQQHAERVRSAHVSLDAAQAELSLRRDIASETKRAAQAARDAYTSDLVKFANADAGEREALKRIKEKQFDGVALTREEEALASRYNEFAGFAESSAVARARAAGAEYILSEGKSDSERLAADAKVAAERAAKAELTLNNKIEVVVKLEGITNFADPVLDELKPLIEDAQKQIQQNITKMGFEVQQAYRASVNNRQIGK